MRNFLFWFSVGAWFMSMVALVDDRYLASLHALLTCIACGLFSIAYAPKE